MIDDELFPDVPLELIVASLFVSPEPFTIVLQPQTAFLRVLNILANRNWCLEPIIINFNQELTRKYQILQCIYFIDFSYHKCLCLVPVIVFHVGPG